MAHICLSNHHQVFKVETAGDCYIVAGGLMKKGSDGMFHIDSETNAAKGAENVMAFSKVRNGVQQFMFNLYFRFWWQNTTNRKTKLAMFVPIVSSLM